MKILNLLICSSYLLDEQNYKISCVCKEPLLVAAADCPHLLIHFYKHKHRIQDSFFMMKSSNKSKHFEQETSDNIKSSSRVDVGIYYV